LYRVWNAFFVLSNGTNAEKIPAHVFAEMAERAGKRFIQAGLHPIKGYFAPTMVQRRKAA